ncbi:MAG: hypothetical protein AB7D00_10090 [Rhodospirillaceae bacterium]
MAEIEDGIHKLLFGIRRSICYHNHRCETHGIFSGFATFVNITGGCGAVITLLTNIGGQLAPICLSSAIAIISALELILGCARKHYLHQDLSKRFKTLEAEIIDTAEPTDDDLRRWTQRRLKIEEDEPTKLSILDVMCHNELVRADGCDSDDFWEIGPIQRLLANFYDFRPDAIRKRGTK